MKTCKRCLYNQTIPKIIFNEQDICNYCLQFDEMDAQYPTNAEGKKVIDSYVEQMKLDGKGKKYDVVIGLSGGCDSSYMLHLAKNVYGLRVLAAHFDNTFNSKIAVENIEVMVKKLDIDLYTHVVDNLEYQGIMRSFFKASVPEIDAPTDLGFATMLYMVCSKYSVKHIWEGHSFRTEGITPPGWVYMDAKYITSIHKIFGDNKPIKTLPLMYLHKWLYWMVFKKIKKFRPIYYLDYNKEKIKKFLADEYGWQWYGGHHMENRTAYFANNYFLPKKFGIDLRMCEFSGLIRSGQKNKEDALVEISIPKPIDKNIEDEIRIRCGFSEQEWAVIWTSPKKHYTDYPTYKRTFEILRPLFFILYKNGYVNRSFYDKFCVMKDKQTS
jgi:N-acetyl sugar amidotransferase